MRGSGLVVLLVLVAGCAVPSGVRSATTLACVAPCARVIDPGVRWEPTVAVDPKDARHVVVVSNENARTPTGRQFWPLVSVTHDAGATWTTTRLHGGPTSPPTAPLFRYQRMGDPALQFLPDGTLLLALVADANTPSTPLDQGEFTGDPLVVLRSMDGGSTFPDVVFAHQGQGTYGDASLLEDAQDKEWFALARDGTILLAWSRDTGDSLSGVTTDLVFATSKDEGRSWSPVGTIAHGGHPTAAQPAILDDGTWVVAFLDRSGSVHVSRSVDHGLAWEDASLGDASRNPTMAVARSPHAAERLYLAYAATKDGDQAKQPPTLRWSDDEGLTWSAPLALDAPEAKGMTMPTVAALPDGSAAVMWWHALAQGAQLEAAIVRGGIEGSVVPLDTNDVGASNVGDYMGLAALPNGSAIAVYDTVHGSDWSLDGAWLASP